MIEQQIASMRRRIPDLDCSLFSDYDLEGYLEDNEGNVKLAVASVWEAMAGSHLLLFKANVRSDNESVTASEQSKLYLERARALRAEALDELYPWRLVGGETVPHLHTRGLPC